MTKTPRRPRDPNQLAKLIVDLSVGEAEERVAVEPPKNAAAQELGRKGGRVRAERMSEEDRRKIAAKAAAARWGRKD